MGTIGLLLYIYALPAAMIFGTLAGGAALAHRSWRRKAASPMAYGIAIAASSLFVGIGIVWISATQTHTYYKLLLLLVPPLTLAGLIGVTILSVSIALIVLWTKRHSLKKAGYSRLPHPLAMEIAACFLIAAAVLTWVLFLGPRWQMQPYTSLSSSVSVDSVTLNAWLPGRDRSETIIVIDKPHTSGASASFDLSSLDALGNITLNIDPDPQAVGDELSLPIPFEPSAYILAQDGTLERVSDDRVQ